MAIQGDNGELISHDSEGLIKELEADIKEFGEFKAYAFYDWYNGAKIYTGYNFYEESKPDDKHDTVNAKYLLKYFNKQNSIL